MIGELAAEATSASAVAVALGVWTFFGWCWWTGPDEKRPMLVAAFGLVTASAFAGGLLGGMALGTFGLSSLGALAGGLAAAVVLDRVRRGADRWMLDHLVPGGVAGLAVARLGCLFEGCDFGRRVDAAWAVEYAADSRAWEVHVAEYGLSTTAETTLSVHPFAGYLAVWGLAAAVVAELVRRNRGETGMAAATGAGLFLAGGGAIEWFREPTTVIRVADGVSAYPLIYWAGALFVGVVWWRYRSRLERTERR